MPPDKTQEDFLKDLAPTDVLNPLEQPLTPEPATEEEEEEPGEEARNRRERRLQAKLQAEREYGIAMAAKLEVLTEAQRLQREVNPELDETISRIYGTDTPEALAATQLLQKAIKSAEDRAAERALEAFREEQRQASQAVAHEEQNLDDMIEELEDEYGVAIDAQTQKGFFTLLEKLSPKDREGNILEYADHHAVWEELQSRKAPANTRAKDLASRSMVRNGAPTNTSVTDDATERFLRENGII